MGLHKKPRRVPIPSVVVEQYPEHAKMNTHVETSWAIRDFLTFLADRGIFLSRVQSEKVIHVTPGQVDAALLEFRGVDVPAYQVEKATLLARHGRQVMAGVYENLDSDRAGLMGVVMVLDQLGVPAWAGRPTCAQALRDAGFAQPDTNVFAQVVKLRKSLYGIVDQYNGHEQPELPIAEPIAEPVPRVDDGTEEYDSRAALLAMLRGGEDVQESR
jgi:hypothetical protein